MHVVVRDGIVVCLKVSKNLCRILTPYSGAGGWASDECTIFVSFAGSWSAKGFNYCGLKLFRCNREGYSRSGVVASFKSSLLKKTCQKDKQQSQTQNSTRKPLLPSVPTSLVEVLTLT